jgi:hypothetical protein
MNVQEVCRFMGLVGYYRRFIQRFFEDRKSNHGIAEEKQEIHVWTEKCVESFQKIKEILMTSVDIKVP